MIMKQYGPVLSCLILLSTSSLLANKPYWQQEVRYDIRVTLDDAAHTLKGFETMIYSNNSPDTLHYIYIHCWPNAYKDNHTALYRQLSQLEERKNKLKKIKDNGYIDQLAFTVDGVKANAEADSPNTDILKLSLPAALAPGKSLTIATPFFVKIPSYFSRMGHEGKSYMITQWYPKPAVYDSKGWHPMPYLDQGEFYSEFGSFDVHITLPGGYVVGATGQLLTTSELDAYKRIGAANHEKPSAPTSYKPQTQDAKTLDYHADNVHDFAWFADKDLIIQYDTLQLASGRTIDVFAYY
ncbi:MAG TPA: M1 family peptidase, partial [Puia sp.]